MRLALSALVAALTLYIAQGVAADGPTTISPETDLRAATARAVAKWNAWLGYERLVVGEGGIPIIWNDELDVAAGYYPDERIEVSSKLYDPDKHCLWCAVYHELGHVLDMEHGDRLYGLDEGPER